jgi:hypothetical protein
MEEINTKFETNKITWRSISGRTIKTLLENHKVKNLQTLTQKKGMRMKGRAI